MILRTPHRRAQITFPLLAQSGHAEERNRCRYWGQSGHGLLQCKCPLMTQSGHRGRNVLAFKSYRGPRRRTHATTPIHHSFCRCGGMAARCACAAAGGALDRWRMSETSVIIDGIRSPLLEFGPAGSDEAVVFVHGNPGSIRDWDVLARGVGEFGRALAIDMPA